MPVGRRGAEPEPETPRKRDEELGVLDRLRPCRDVEERVGIDGRLGVTEGRALEGRMEGRDLDGREVEGREVEGRTDGLEVEGRAEGRVVEGREVDGLADGREDWLGLLVEGRPEGREEPRPRCACASLRPRTRRVRPMRRVFARFCMAFSGFSRR